MLTIKLRHVLLIVLALFIGGALTSSVGTYRAYFGFGLVFLFAILVLIHLVDEKLRANLINSMSKGYGLLFLVFLIYMVIFIFAYVDTKQVTFITSVRYFSSNVGGVLATLIFLTLFRDSSKEKKLIILFSFVLATIALYQVYNTRNILVIEKSTDNVVTNWALVSAGLFPFVFYIKRTSVRFLLMSLIMAAILLGNKRSGLLAIGLSIASLVLYSLFYRREVFSIKYMFAIMVGVVILFLSFNFYSDLYLNSFGRLQNITDDGGSGRVGLWLEIWDFVTTSSWIDLFFGGGANYYNIAVNSYYSSPHNDFLELFLSYGFFGALFYFFVLFRLVYLSIYYGAKRNELAFFSISLLSVFVVMSNVSGVFIYYTNYLPIFIGFAVLEISKKTKEI